VRGGGKVGIEWKDGRLAELKLQSDHAKKCRIVYSDKSAEAQIEHGKPIVLDGALHTIGL